MMSLKQWLALLLLYTLYLILGALVFQVLEAPHDYQTKLEKATKEKELLNTVIETATHFEKANSVDQLVMWNLMHKVEDARGSILPKDVNSTVDLLAQRKEVNCTLDEEVKVEHHWDLWNTFYFSFITITTIGYGHLYPQTTWGQQFCILYSLFGIPLNTIVFVNLSTFYTDFVMYEEDKDVGQGRTNIALILRAMWYLLPGLVIFLILPSLVFMLVEGWDFFQSYYFTFISLTTIGYGDMVVGHPHQVGGWDVLYKGFIMLWTVFGLSYLIMVVGFLVNALTSKKVRKITKKRLNKINRLIRLFSAQNKIALQTNIQLNKNNKLEEGGVDNQAFTISDTVTETPIHFKSFRRKSLVEKILPENQRHADRRGSLPHVKKSNDESEIRRQRSVSECAPAIETVEVINELIDAVEDLIENEFQEEIAQIENEADTNSPVQTTEQNTESVSLPPTETDANSMDVTIHV